MTDPSETQEAMLHRVLDGRKSWLEKNPKTTALLVLVILGFVSPGAATFASGYVNGAPPAGVRPAEVKKTVNERVGHVEFQIDELKEGTIILDEKIRAGHDEQAVEAEYQTELLEEIAIKNRVRPKAERKIRVLKARRKAAAKMAEPILAK